MINPHREYPTPTTQKKRTFLSFAVVPGLVGLVIGSFVSVGRVVDMPRVPDGRAGVYNGQDC
jgi:hypothetical protein